MKKKDLQSKVSKFNGTTKEAIETIIAALNQGQKKKIAKDEKVQAILARYGIVID